MLDYYHVRSTIIQQPLSRCFIVILNATEPFVLTTWLLMNVHWMGTIVLTIQTSPKRLEYRADIWTNDQVRLTRCVDVKVPLLKCARLQARSFRSIEVGRLADRRENVWVLFFTRANYRVRTATFGKSCQFSHWDGYVSLGDCIPDVVFSRIRWAPLLFINLGHLW